MAMRKNNLFNVLLNFFPESDAFLLATLLDNHLHKETICYHEIDVAESQKKDLMLLAFEERIMIPVKSRSGPAWEDRIFDFTNEGRYFIPPVVKAIADTIHDIGELSCDTALRTTLATVNQEDIGGFIKLLQTIMKHADNCTFEAGLLKLFFKEISMDSDLHDVIDIFVIFGIMSPCPRRSLMTGLSWYEINSTLFWDKAFLV
jgi:hypothetical protein